MTSNSIDYDILFERDGKEFIDYVDSFYGTNDPLYPLMSAETKQPLGKLDILRATLNYIDLCMKGDLEYVHYTHGVMVIH